MHSSNLGFQSKFSALSLALMPIVLWLALHGYHGLTGDAQIYAFQAVARLHPPLTADLYLQNTSQDQFTLFSPMYAWCIGFLGLENAARILTLLSTLWLVVAAWSFSSAVTGRDIAWLAVAFLLIVSGDYGAAGVFRVVEPFLTARLPAEALIITALACNARGMKGCGLVLALGALVIHPLMALPGLLLILCLWMPVRLGTVGAVAGVLAALVVSVLAITVPMISQVLPVMDASWLNVVRERSEFLFLQLWSIHDWDINLRPFICLGFTAIAAVDDRIRKLCAAAALVGTTGLAVAFIGSLVGPVAILVQGQAWRWAWIAAFVSVILIPSTALKVWRDEKCGPLCALLLVSGCVLPGTGGTVCVSLALILWVTRTRISARFRTHFRWASAVFGVAITTWILMQCWIIVAPEASALGHAPLNLRQMQGSFALTVSAVLVGLLTWWGTRSARATGVPMLTFTILVALAICVFPAAFRQSHALAVAADVREFSDWANAIPPTSTVLVTPPKDVGAFVWFTLGRPNYLALDQSTGVVFSRATALEVRRRSEVLLPLMDPDWKIMTRRRTRMRGGHKNEDTAHPLTSKTLVQVCADPRLGFVISPEMVGFDPLRHQHMGAWKDWNLYDCQKVRSTRSAT